MWNRRIRSWTVRSPTVACSCWRRCSSQDSTMKLFDVTPVSSWILVDSPRDAAVAAANRLQVAESFHKGIRLKGIDAVFDLDADRSLVRGRDDVEVRLGPVCRRRQIVHRDLAQRPSDASSESEDGSRCG